MVTQERSQLVSSNDNFCELFTCSNTIQNIPQNLVAYSENSETEIDDVQCNVRRGSRHRIPNAKYADDYISPTISPNLLSRALSPKRNICSSTEDNSDNAPEKTQRFQRKKAKRKPSNISNKSYRTTLVGNLNLLWPRYGIKDCRYADELYCVTQTCSIDTALFALYHAYKAGTDKFRNLFESKILNAFVVLRETFQCVEKDGWDIGRLYWLVRHNLLTLKNFDNEYDMENTLTKAVFDMVRPMQEYDVRSVCTCTVCPKRTRQHSSFDITLR